MITHVVTYKIRGSECFYVKLFHSWEAARKWIKHHEKYQNIWILREITGYSPENGEAVYYTLEVSQDYANSLAGIGNKE